MKEENYIWRTLRTIKKEPLPKGLTSRELVEMAIEFRNPPRVPYYFLYHKSAADIVFLGPLSASKRPTNGKIGDHYQDEWGVTWEVTGRYWDHPIAYPLSDLKNLANFRFPDYTREINQVKLFSRMANFAGKYVLGLNPIGLFQRLRSLMGFEEMMMAPYTQPDAFRDLLDRLANMTIESIKTYQQVDGFHGFESVEDWGLQNSLQMKLDTFREFYKPVYKRIIDACHKCGMHYFWHNCGYIADMFPDMIELGVDVLQLDQPRLMGHQKLIDQLGGRICMWNTVDIQWCTLENVSLGDIQKEVEGMLQTYDPPSHRGGFIAKHYPQPWDIELSVEKQICIYRSFLDNHYCQLS
jgi:uroporphyrinogen decarboxylase